MFFIFSSTLIINERLIGFKWILFLFYNLHQDAYLFPGNFSKHYWEIMNIVCNILKIIILRNRKTGLLPPETPHCPVEGDRDANITHVEKVK